MEEKLFFENLERKKKSIGLIHKVYLIQLKNSRKYLASTKTKSEVRGGGKKPWRQKGTGNARAGSTRSPLWVGGGVTFGPKPRIVDKKINKKERRLAILSGLYLKKNSFRFIDDNIFSQMEMKKTKDFLKFLQTLNITLESKTLLIVPDNFKNIWISARNLKNIEIISPTCLSVNHLLNSNNILLSKQSLEIINTTYGKSYL
jgi:large subunit ribosomal protein L4